MVHLGNLESTQEASAAQGVTLTLLSCSDWSKFDRWVYAVNLRSICKLFYWYLKLTEFCVMLWCFWLPFSTGCTKWNTAAIKILLLFIAGFFNGFLVEKCAASQSHRNSDFGWHRSVRRLYNFHLAWFLRGLAGAASRLVSLSNYRVRRRRTLTICVPYMR